MSEKLQPRETVRSRYGNGDATIVEINDEGWLRVRWENGVTSKCWLDPAGFYRPPDKDIARQTILKLAKQVPNNAVMDTITLRRWLQAKAKHLDP